MAVYTKLTKADISELLAEYDLGKLSSFKGIAEGIENTNYLVSTSAERFILTLFEKRTKSEDLPFFMKFTEWLSDRGIPCPRPIHGKDGRVIREVAGKPAALIQFLQGQGRPNVTHYHIRQLGALIANMHLAAADFPMARENTLGLAGWQKIFSSIEKQADKIMPGLTKLMGDELDYLAKNWPSDLPVGIVHADLFPDNVFFQRDELSGVIDFYFSCRDFWMYDLLICLNAWCFNGAHQFIPARARILLQSYHGIRQILPEERAVLPVLARGAALRFLLTRSYDWLNRQPGAMVTPKDPLEYVEKLKFYHTRNPLSPL